VLAEFARAPVQFLRFAWWNVESLAHYDAARASMKRWPGSPEEAAAHLQRIADGLRALRQLAAPDFIGLAEVTGPAAVALRDAAFPGFAVESLDHGRDPSANGPFQIAAIFDRARGLASSDLLVPVDVPEPTRPMLTLDYRWPPHRLRIYLCHWTSRRGEEQSERVRRDVAQQLRKDAYRFLHDPDAGAERRHVAILGDLNEEPFDNLLKTELFASRDRWGALSPDHPTDLPVKRVRFYNASWRLLGERVAHPAPAGAHHAAGTFFWRRERAWFTYDQLLVTGSLLTDEPPFLDEASLSVASGAMFVGADGRPGPFEYNEGQSEGASDHLPVCGRFVIPEEEQP
jgi:hypothetical protein